MDTAVSRRATLAALAMAAIGGCIGQVTDRDDADGIAGTAGVSEARLDTDFETVFVGPDSPVGGPANAPPIADRVLPLPLSPADLAEHAVDAAPPPDGVPSLDEPSFWDVEGAEFYTDDLVMFGVVGESEVKAYPRIALVWHEIVNDVIDGTPVSVTYCPLTGTAQGFERGETEFGVSGYLLNNNLVMYDREALRWWPQIAGVSLPGTWNEATGGAPLREFEVVRTTWGQWRRAYPETEVMDLSTGFARDYEYDPYESQGYYESDETIFENVTRSDRHHAKTWVYGTRTADGAMAVLKDTLVTEGLVAGRIDGTPYVAVYDETLDTSVFYRNPDDRTMRMADGKVVDGDGTEYGPHDLPLERVISFDAFWFAWSAFYPNTVIYE